MAYQGHKNWNHWNVSLWLHNDEGLYTLMQDIIAQQRRAGRTLDDAAEQMMATLRAFMSGYPETPDGAPYSYTAIRAAMQGE